MIIQNKNSSYIQNLYKNEECSILNGQREDTMNKTSKKYIMNYFLQVILNIILISLIVWYCSKTTIEYFLFLTLPVDLFQFSVAFSVLGLLVIFLIAELVFMILVIKQTKKGDLDDSVKKARFILPIVFIFLLHFAFWVPIGLTKSTSTLTNSPIFASKTSDKDIFDEEPYIGNICEKNILGKAAYYENDILSVNFSCYYHEAYTDFMKTRFINESEKDIALQKKVTGNGYVAYYGTKYGAKCYTFLIQKGNIFYSSTYYNEDVDDFEYSFQEFIKDSLSIYNQWFEY